LFILANKNIKTRVYTRLTVERKEYLSNALGFSLKKEINTWRGK
jgi:hypothetical protein